MWDCTGRTRGRMGPMKVMLILVSSDIAVPVGEKNRKHGPGCAPLTILLQNQILSPSFVLSSTYHPPPAALNEGPYEFATTPETLQPTLSLTSASQSVVSVAPVCARVVGMVQFAVVWSVIRFGLMSFTPSIMSTYSVYVYAHKECV